MRLAEALRCPICDASPEPLGERYSVEELLALWKPVQFSSETVEEHLRQAGFTSLYRCPSCRLQIFLPQVIGTPRFYTEAYGLDDASAKGTLPYSAGKWDFTEALKDLRGTGRILEIGCGPGNFLDQAARIVRVAEGIESNPHARQLAQAKGHVVHQSLDNCCPAEPYDAAFAFHVLEHLPDPVGFLRSVESKVRRGGVVALSMPNRSGPIRFIHPCVQDMPPHHATRWEPLTLRRLGARLGWKIERLLVEPLSRDSWYYYIAYAPQHFFPGGSAIAHLARTWCARLLTLTLRMTDRFGWRRLLPGQAMYVVYRLPA